LRLSTRAAEIDHEHAGDVHRHGATAVLLDQCKREVDPRRHAG
jgi:hypothetical protein